MPSQQIQHTAKCCTRIYKCASRSQCQESIDSSRVRLRCLSNAELRLLASSPLLTPRALVQRACGTRREGRTRTANGSMPKRAHRVMSHVTVTTWGSGFDLSIEADCLLSLVHAIGADKECLDHKAFEVIPSTTIHPLRLCAVH
jgi:hypothetical protein